MANPELGAKQICPTCQSKFYDLNRRPATCPKCGEVFDPEEALRSRRTRARAAPPDYDADDEKPVAPKVEPEGFEDEEDTTPELDEVVDEVPVEDEEAGDDAGAPTPPATGDIGVDFAEDEELGEEAGDDVPFLEDDEDDEDFAEDEIDGLPGEDAEDV
ncbi:MAG: hypothetical protein JWM33_2009 [Caulobacteraceae bacterium]|nr:hypothetical protein [Caulobacteraceae bacterium]